MEITPIINSGDQVGDDFQYTGVPDGIGIYASAPDRLEVFTNHELSYRYGDPAWSRVSHLTLDPQGNVVSASYAVDGTERYEYFCSSTMDMIDGTPWYFTGEEWFASPRGGTSIAINALTGTVIHTPQFGSLNHENVVPVHGLDRAVVYLSEDSFRLRSQAYAYFAHDFRGAIHGDGAFSVWVPDDQGDGDPSTNDIAKGQTLSGRFVTIPHADRYTGLQLNEAGRGARLVQLRPYRGRHRRSERPRRRVLLGHGSEQVGDEARSPLPDDVRPRAPAPRHPRGGARR